MADTINKPSIQIRSGLPSPLPDKTPSPATKLLISHGKPNFTIARSPSTRDNGNASNPLSPQPQPNANNNYNAYKSASSSSSSSSSSNIYTNGHSNNSNSNSSSNNSNKFVVGTKFNGVYKLSSAAVSWASNGESNGNEAAQVVLRRPKLITHEEPQAAAGEDENVPEFIRRQRRIQERLAKEKVLDFENRRSGYFTHVVISPDSPNRTSFVETMASPAIVPALEMPLPTKIEEEQQEAKPATNGHSEQPEEKEQEQAKPATNGHSEQPEEKEQEQAKPATNGHSEQPEAGSISNGHSNGHSEQQEELQEEPKPVVSNGHAQQEDVAAEEVAKAIEEVNKAVAGEDDDSKPETEAEVVTEVKAEESAPIAVQAQIEVVAALASAAVQASAASEQNGHSNGHAEDITISHTNGHTTSDVPSLPTPDPSGALGVNYEPKTVVSFSQELGGGENNYPDTVKVTKDVEPKSPAEAELQELSKLKFDIKNDAQNEVQVTPVLRAE